MLYFAQGPGPRFDFKAEGNTLRIGRMQYGADIEIASPAVSRLHALIEFVPPGQLFLHDQQSTNGTYLNGVRVQNATLRTGDIISFQKNNPDCWIVVNAPAESHPAETSAFIPIEQLIGPQKNLFELLEVKQTVSIGRQDCDIILSNLTISRKHTEVKRLPDGQYLVRDLGSKNGTFVNGQVITAPKTITDQDVIQVGKYEFNLRKPLPMQTDTNIEPVVLVAEQLSRYVGKGTQRRALLHQINLEIRPGEMVAIMGPSGSGKSTLLKALNGDAPASQGRVFVHGRDFYRDYRLLKHDIGYVPQDDIVHRQLSVHDSLYFAARLRLAQDLSRKEIDKKIDETLAKLGIGHIKNSLIQDISGGQRKRVSIAVELLSDPSILFLDEPTSPLDPETVEEFLKILKNLAASGTTILMVTHKPDDLEIADKVVFMARGGYLAYFGDTQNYLGYFQAKNVIAVYATISDPSQGKAWADNFTKQQTRLSSGPEVRPGLGKVPRQGAFRQYFWLTARYFRTKTNDRVNTAILVLQAPIIAGFLAILFEKLMLQTLFLMIIAAVWLGTSNAAREIISEWPVYRRERMFNLRILPYVFSKITVISVFSLVQMVLLVAMVQLRVEIPHYLATVALLFALAMLGTLLGLFLSSVFDNADKVMSLVPLVLLPQIMLAGVIQRLNNQSEWLSFLTASRWGIELMAQVSEKAYFFYPEKIPNPDYYEPLREVPPLDTLQRQAIEARLSQQAVPDTLYQYVSEPILGNANMLRFPHYFTQNEALLYLGLQGLVLFVAIFLVLRRKDRL